MFGRLTVDPDGSFRFGFQLIGVAPMDQASVVRSDSRLMGDMDLDLGSCADPESAATQSLSCAPASAREMDDDGNWSLNRLCLSHLGSTPLSPSAPAEEYGSILAMGWVG